MKKILLQILSLFFLALLVLSVYLFIYVIFLNCNEPGGCELAGGFLITFSLIGFILSVVFLSIIFNDLRKVNNEDKMLK